MKNMGKENKGQKNIDFFTTTTHHVWSPVYTLKKYLEELANEEPGKINEKQKQYIGACRENVEKIENTVSRLVQVMEIEEGRYEPKEEKLDITKEVKGVVSANFPFVRASNARIVVKSEKEPVFVFADKEKIKEVLEELITNAVKYKSSGEGVVKIKVEEREEDVLCLVEDNGVGLSKEERKRIFDRFYRAKSAIYREPEGLGLGLFICKHIIELNGGDIWVKGNDNEGETFFFTLPRAVN